MTRTPDSRRRPLGRLASLAAALALSACATPPIPGIASFGASSKMPVGRLAGDQPLSPFYQWTAALPDRPGVMLREEPIAAQPELDAAGTAHRILYTSRDARWGAGILPVSGTLYLPKGNPPAGGWPLAAWAHGTLGVADVCAPSWATHKPRDAAYINRWLAAGFAVVATDYQGLGGPGPHPYLIWESEGRSVLDSVRAALAARPGRIANAVIVTGQSQGSGSALGSALIAPAYAPELKLLGAVATGVVSTFPDAAYQPPTGNVAGAGAPHFTILSMLGGGLVDRAPSVDSLMSARGKPLLDEARRACSPEVSALARQLKVDMAGAFSVDLDALAKLRRPVTDMPSQRIAVPLLLGTGQADRLITPRRQYGAVAALCAAGNAVTWQQYAGIGHNGSPHATFDDALAFARARLADRPVPGNCAQAREPGAPGAMTPGIPHND